MCREELTQSERDSAANLHVIGEEAHILSTKPGGPRHDAAITTNHADSYENLILLCSIDHKMIDDDPKQYSAGRLLQIKSDHEKWVSERLQDRPKMPKLAIKGRAGGKLLLKLCSSGGDLLGMCHGFHAYSFSYDEPRSSRQVDLLAEFGDMLDEVDLVDELGPGYAVTMASRISDWLSMLQSEGMRLFAGVDRGKLEVDGEEAQDWLVLVIHIAHEDSANVKKRPR